MIMFLEFPTIQVPRIPCQVLFSMATIRNVPQPGSVALKVNLGLGINQLSGSAACLAKHKDPSSIPEYHTSPKSESEPVDCFKNVFYMGSTTTETKYSSQSVSVEKALTPPLEWLQGNETWLLPALCLANIQKLNYSLCPIKQTVCIEQQ